MTEYSIVKKIDKITHIDDEHLGTRIPAPRSVKIELTGRCPYRCSFCALTLRAKQPTKDMDFDLYKRIVKEMVDAGVEEIGMFYIGESFLCPELLCDAIAYAKSVGIKYCFLTTNGAVAFPDRVEKAMKAGLDSLKFSLTTSDDEQFEKVIGVPARMRHQAIANIKAARKIRDDGGYKCGLYASSIKYNDDQDDLMKKAVDELLPYLDQHYWLPLYSFGSLAADNAKDHGLHKVTPGNMGRIGGLVSPMPCWCVFTEGHVLHDGKLTLCGFDAGKADHNWVCADLNEVSFMEGWNSMHAVRLRATHLRRDVSKTPCASCAMYGNHAGQPKHPMTLVEAYGPLEGKQPAGTP